MSSALQAAVRNYSNILIVSFSVQPDVEVEFNHFYHRQFLPCLLKESPEFTSIRRYEEFGNYGSLRWYDKQFLTIYELDAKQEAVKLDEIFARPAVVDVVKQFRAWKDKSLRNFARIAYEQTWSHARKPLDGAFCGRPFFLWQLEMKPELDQEFQQWYQDDYLPLQVAEVPTWSSVLRYQSLDCQPVRRLTFFEANDEAVLAACIRDLRTPARMEQNIEWHGRVQAAVTWQDATSFRPIYRWPD